MKRVCKGCVMAAQQRGLGDNCPFCRTPVPKDDASALALIQKRIDVGDAEAMGSLAAQYYVGGHGVGKDVQRAIELWRDAAKLGSIDEHYPIGCVYYHGHGIQKDECKGLGHWECAAMNGDAESRHSLGVVKSNEGNYQLALKHYLISAKMGYKPSLDNIKELFIRGHATKAQYAEARGYQDAVEETKSQQREDAKGFIKVTRMHSNEEDFF